MKDQIIIKHYDPFPFLEIENMYSENELKLIWQELEFLNQLDKFEGEEETASAIGPEGEILKKNSGLFLDEIYNSRKISKRVNYFRCNLIFIIYIYNYLKIILFNVGSIKNSTIGKTPCRIITPCLITPALLFTASN